MANFTFPKKTILKIGNATSGSKLKVILRQKSWMKKSKLQATGLNYESAKRPKRFLNFLPPPISLGLSWRWLVMEIFYSASGHRLKHQHLFLLNHSVQRPLTPKTDYLPFIRFCPRNPQSWHFFLVNFQFNQDSGFAYMVFLALASYYVYTKNMEPKLPKTCMGLLDF